MRLLLSSQFTSGTGCLLELKRIKDINGLQHQYLVTEIQLGIVAGHVAVNRFTGFNMHIPSM